jgi:Mce-associated membrane protein
MSPRRKIDAAQPDIFTPAAPKARRRPRRWGLPLLAALAAVLVAAAITASTLMLVSHERDQRAQSRDTEVLSYVRSFMTIFTTLDPFHANYYADRIQSQGTGDFAKSFKERVNEIMLQVARSQPTQGAVLEAGVQRWNDNGSADVLVATKITTKSTDGKSIIESGNRWVVTAIKEGQLWKISNLIPVI